MFDKNPSKARFVNPQPTRIFETFINQNNKITRVTMVAANPIVARERLEKLYGKNSVTSTIKCIG